MRAKSERRLKRLLASGTRVAGACRHEMLGEMPTAFLKILRAKFDENANILALTLLAALPLARLLTSAVVKMRSQRRHRSCDLLAASISPTPL